jgi:hypothetical protein
LRGQRHSRSRRHGIEFTGDQHRDITGLMDVTGELSGAISGSPKDIGAGRADNGRAGVLSDHQMVKVAALFFTRERQIGVDEKRRAVDM